MKQIAALMLSLILLGCQISSADPHDGGVLYGNVTRGPLSPVARPGQSEPPAGVTGAKIEIATGDGQPFTSVQTDSSGSFRVSLPAGTYRVSMPSLYGAMFTRDLPATIVIAPGQEKRLDIHLDTGIR